MLSKMPLNISFLSKLKLPSIFQKRSMSAPFDDIPTSPGGAVLVHKTGTKSSRLLHGVMQASNTVQHGPVFLVGMLEEEIAVSYPTAKRLMPVEKIGKVSMTPSSAITILRVLFSRTELADVLYELSYLEHAGAQLSKPGPLAMVPSWVREQLSPEGIYRVFCSPQSHEAVVGGAFKALFNHPGFSFDLLDGIYAASQSKKISHAHESKIKHWSQNADKVATTLGALIDSPPLSLQFLPAIRDAQESSTPSVWYIHPDDLESIAPVLDALILSHGLKQRHHWYIDATRLGEASPLGLNALQRLSAALWQLRDAREEGYGPAMWCDLGGIAPPIASSPAFQNRAIQGASIVLGDEQAVMESVINSIGVAEEAFDWESIEGRQGMFHPKSGKFRHFHEHELEAIKEHVLFSS